MTAPDEFMLLIPLETKFRRIRLSTLLVQQIEACKYFDGKALEKFVKESNISLITVFDKDPKNHSYVIKFFDSSKYGDPKHNKSPWIELIEGEREVMDLVLDQTNGGEVTPDKVSQQSNMKYLKESTNHVSGIANEISGEEQESRTIECV